MVNRFLLGMERRFLTDPRDVLHAVSEEVRGSVESRFIGTQPREAFNRLAMNKMQNVS